MIQFRHLLLILLATLLTACGPKGAKQYNAGVESYKAQKYQEAISAFSQTIKMNPDFAEAYLSLGLCHYQLKQYDKAREFTKKGIELLDQGQSVDTKDKWTPQQKTALGHWHMGLISEGLYRQSITKDNKAAISHLKQARTDYQKAAQLDSSNMEYAKRVKLTDDLLKKMGT